MLRGALGLFLVISGGIVLASFGRVPFPGPGIKWRDPLAPAGPRRYHLCQFRRSRELPPFLLQEKNHKSASLIFFFVLI